MIKSNMEIVILAESQEKGDAALRKMEKRFFNSVLQGKLVFTVKVIGELDNSESKGVVWVDETFFEEDEPWK